MPVLAAVQGACIGGGVDMICAADSRYCTEDAYFCIKETQLGMTADVGTLQRLPHLISQGLARELAYTGRKLGAQEALACGLVNRVFPSRDERKWRGYIAMVDILNSKGVNVHVYLYLLRLGIELF